MTKNEKECEKEGYHTWRADWQCIEEVDSDFEYQELELKCLRCGATVSLTGYWDEAPKNWKPMHEVN